MLRQLINIAQNTATESIRQPIFVVLVLLGGVMMVLNVPLSANSMEVGGLGDNRMMIDMGMSTIAVVGVLLAAFTATGVLSREIENKTVLTVVSKPVSRPVFVLGKYLGVAAAITLSTYILSLGFVLAVRHQVMSTASHHFDMPVILFGVGGLVAALAFATWSNYYLNWVFSSTLIVTLAIAETLAVALVLVIGKQWVFQSPVTEFAANDGLLVQLCIGLLMVNEAVLLLTAVAVAASTRLGQVMTLVVCGGVFLLGLVTQSMSGYVNWKLSLAHDTPVGDTLGAIWQSEFPVISRLAYTVAESLYAVFPNLQFLWPTDAISLGNPFSAGYVGLVTAYAGLQLAAVLAVAIALFQKREVG